MTQTAYKFLLECGYTRFPISPYDILDELKDYVVCLPWSTAKKVMKSEDPFHLRQLKAEGRTIRMRGTGMYYIVYDDVTVNSPDRISWTIMHEIGHIILGHLVEFSETALNRGGMTSKQYGVLEVEAHYFAAEFLMPTAILKYYTGIQSVQLCFTTDPFMYGYHEIQEMSLAAIRRLNRDNIKCCILTKGLLPIELKDLYSENEYGITLISLNEDYREKTEPGAASYADRLAALRTLHDAGCKTWVSIEPYPTPNLVDQDLGEILEAVSFADRIIFGRTNYNKTVSAYKENKHFYNECAEEVIAFCEERGISYHIKAKTQTKE